MIETEDIVIIRRRRLKEWIDTKCGGMQSVFVGRTGINQGELSALLKEKSFGEKKARRLEHQAGMPPLWLDQGAVSETRADYNVSQPAEVKRRVPVISWVAAGKFCHSDDPFPPGVADEWIGATANVGPRAYALRVDGDSMEPRFPDGCTIIVDPDWEARHKSFVVVRLEGSDETTFKQLMVEGGKRYLKPLNPRYPIIELSETAVICGVVRQSLQIETFE